jgi:hypothetical protein
MGALEKMGMLILDAFMGHLTPEIKSHNNW